MRLLLISIVILLGCKEHIQPPTTCEQIQGVWRGVDYPKNLYSFSDGTAWTKQIYSGVVIYQNDYAYSCDGDTIKLIDVTEGTRTVFAVNFPTDTTAVLDGIFSIKIKRVK